MGTKKTTGIILLIVGIAVLVLALGADLAGIGNAPAFGRMQIASAIVGAVVAIVGLVLTLRK